MIIPLIHLSNVEEPPVGERGLNPARLYLHDKAIQQVCSCNGVRSETQKETQMWVAIQPLSVCNKNLGNSVLQPGIWLICVTVNAVYKVWWVWMQPLSRAAGLSVAHRFCRWRLVAGCCSVRCCVTQVTSKNHCYGADTRRQQRED